jgi:exoribonuclease R
LIKNHILDFNQMSNASKLLESILGVQQFQDKPEGIQGILQTKDYTNFIILSDTGDELLQFSGAKLANKCLPGDHVQWDGEKCKLELRDEHPPIIGTLEFTNKSRYGLTSKGIPIYLFTPYNKSYPHFIVGSSEKDVSKNKIGLIKFDDWTTASTFPRGQLQQILGTSGDFEAEKQALIWQASPWRHPKGTHKPQSKENILRRELKGFTFNIDPEGCKDVDDVLTFEQIDENKWRIAITISDVATYVEEGGVVDIYASLISQTLYDNNGTVLRPMLPKEYSEEVCSLTPGKKSFGISLQFQWDGQEITDIEWFESILETNRSYSYEEFMVVDSPYKSLLKDVASYLAKERLDDSPDLESQSKGQSFRLADSHKWIEHCMLFYNMEAGKMLKGAKMGILRRHSMPNLERLGKYNQYPILEKLAYSSAEYCLAEEKETTHFGLSSNAYAHASSPIRRYADLVNQRALKLLIRESSERYIVPQTMYDMNYKSKLNRGFSRDLNFLNAICNNEGPFKGVIIDKQTLDNDFVKIKMYVPEWSKTISTKYKLLSENVALSRDEKREIDITEFREVLIQCTFNINARNWKERVVINVV